MKSLALLVLLMTCSGTLLAGSLDNWPTYGNGQAIVVAESNNVHVTKGSEDAPEEIVVQYEVLEIVWHQQKFEAQKLKNKTVTQTLRPSDLPGGSSPPMPLFVLKEDFVNRLAILPVFEERGDFKVRSNIVFDPWLSFVDGGKELVKRQEVAGRKQIDFIKSKGSATEAVDEYYKRSRNPDAVGHIYLEAGSELLKLVDSNDHKLRVIRAFAEIAIAEKAPAYVRRRALWKLRQVDLRENHDDVLKIRMEYMSRWSVSANWKGVDIGIAINVLDHLRDTLKLANANNVRLELQPDLKSALEACIEQMKGREKSQMAKQVITLAEETLVLIRH